MSGPRFCSVPWTVMAVLLAAGLPGCGGGGSPLDDTGSPPTGDLADDLRDPGQQVPDSSGLVDRPDGSLPEVPGDLPVPHDASSGDPATDPVEDAGPTTGGMGDPCSTMQDCRSGLCLDTGAGGVCTAFCLDRCPEGWVCRGTPISGSDPVFICAPSFWAICSLCESNGDCKTDQGVCRDQGADGRRCSVACDDLHGCPIGFRCDPDPQGQRWCLPETGSCACRAPRDGGRERACQVVNSHGSCPGTQQCLGSGGWAPCQGRVPAAEECNGQDDNCNGLTDEDFPDRDRDGIRDCVDDDMDGDGVGNPEDNCPDIPNPAQEDLDLDGLGDPCDPDRDGDGVGNLEDNCPDTRNPLQEDLDRDGLGDLCDPDRDGDGVPDDRDNCPGNANPGQRDLDLDGLGDPCDPDRDGDGVGNLEDNCPDIPNPGQEDLDLDGLGDLCDPDRDGDGVPDDRDNCLQHANPEQRDLDLDGLGDACDPDLDGDAIVNERDNCPEVYNPGQQDFDQDTLGDACDLDDDNDGIPDAEDNCPLAPNADQADCDRDGPGDACDPDDDNDGALDLVDCAPCDPARYPGATEVCNGLDDNCNAATDEGTEWQCGDYACGGTGGCLISCQRAEDCRAGFFCDGNDLDRDGRQDECLPKVPPGGTCSSAWECAQDYCSNGHCCGAVGDLCCASGEDCQALNAPPTCDAPGQCRGHRTEGYCNDSFACRSRAVDDPSACAGAVCFVGRYCDGSVVRQDRACGSTGSCDRHGSQIQNCVGWNSCCNYGCSNGSCWSSFKTGDAVCVWACYTNPVACIC
ncbi:thrombospondin type 3 repeat-containing protein [Myxococcota bacterium]|nr:thrombospondin type 3 repeat-containing protein [Myxococcota bacterium]